MDILFLNFWHKKTMKGILKKNYLSDYSLEDSPFPLKIVLLQGKANFFVYL